MIAYQLFMAPFGIEQAQYEALAIIPNFLLVLGAILLWLAFVILGIIARRYEIVLNEKTDWQFMMIAPTGILCFALLQLFFCGFSGKMMLPKNSIDYCAYVLFFLSGLLSLIANIRFYNVTRGG